MKKKFVKKTKPVTSVKSKKSTSKKPQAAPVLTKKISLLPSKKTASEKSSTEQKSQKSVISTAPKIAFPWRIRQALRFTQITTLTALSVILSVGSLLLLPEISQLATQRISLLEGKIPQTQVMGMGEVAGIEVTPQVTIKSLNIPAPDFTATAVIAEDLTTDQILYQKNIHKHMLPASTTKLITALVALDYYKMTDILTVKPESLVGGSTMGLVLNEKLTFRSLLYGMLLNSGNDAAFTIAANYPGGISAFVNQMNLKAQSLGLADTHFQNPAGFDDPTHYSSAYDLAEIGKVVANNPVLSEVVDTKQTVVTSVGDTKTHDLKNVDELLSVDGVIGIKTGYTDEAGENFVGLVDRQGEKVLTVVLDSKDRFGETSKLMDWVYQNYQWVNP